MPPDGTFFCQDAENQCYFCSINPVKMANKLDKL